MNTWADETRLVLLLESPQATATFFPSLCVWPVLYATAHKRTYLCSLKLAFIYLSVCWTAPFPALMLIIGWLWARQLFLQLWNPRLNSHLHAASLADRKEESLCYWCLISPMQWYYCQSEIVLFFPKSKFYCLYFHSSAFHVITNALQTNLDHLEHTCTLNLFFDN